MESSASLPRVFRSAPPWRAGWCSLVLAVLSCGPALAQAAKKEAPAAVEKSAVVSSLTPEELADFAANPAPVRRLIEKCLALTKLNLRYQMRSADPAQGGMDCSGTVHHVLRECGVADVPRQSSEQYRWVWQKGGFRAFNGSTMESFELAALKPGDLLFWTGTYETDTRDPPVSHVMIYLGKTKKKARPVMFGASDGRYYDGKAHNGVSVFDFKLPKEGGKARFIGYAPVPGLK